MERLICGTNIHYEIAGNGPRRVVLLHGWGCAIKLMKPVMDVLSPDMTVLALDFPGFGASGKPPIPWGVPDYANAVITLLKELDFFPCSVIAHSFGARVAIQMASEDTALFERIVLTGAAGIKKPQTEESRKRSEEFQKKKELLHNIGKIKLFSKVTDQLEQNLREKYGSKDYNALDADMRATFVKVVNLDLSDRLPMIKQPVLLLWGDRDTETPLWMGQQMEREIPDAGLVVLEGGTHFAYLEQAARFNTIVKHFLEE